MAEIIKVDEKYYRQSVVKEEVTLAELEIELLNVTAEKQARLDEEKQMWDERIAEVQGEIDQLKILSGGK